MAGRSALYYFGAWTLVPLLFMAAAEGMGLLQSGTNVLLWMSVMFVCWAPFWSVIFFLFFASGPALRHAFNLSALHAALPALVTAVLVWASPSSACRRAVSRRARCRSRSARSSAARRR
ncbi:hypothetical protein ACIBCO_39040 [Streptomyces violascens]|uniref:hypothetical protein n=1 Tax=Streptomyces violascens TaxID=67381 RepID=UPI00379783CA